MRSEIRETVLASVRKHWSKSIKRSQLRITSGSSPNGRRRLVEVSTTRAGETLRTGLAFADAAGNLEPIEPFARRGDAYTVKYRVDIDGDGTDEFVVSCASPTDACAR